MVFEFGYRHREYVPSLFALKMRGGRPSFIRRYSLATLVSWTTWYPAASAADSDMRLRVNEALRGPVPMSPRVPCSRTSSKPGTLPLTLVMGPDVFTSRASALSLMTWELDAGSKMM